MIQLHEVFLPPIIVMSQKELWIAEELRKEAKALNIRCNSSFQLIFNSCFAFSLISGTEVYSNVSEHLHKWKQSGATDVQVLTELIKQLLNEKDIFRAEMDRVHSLAQELLVGETTGGLCNLS
jgi:hypothetical protein